MLLLCLHKVNAQHTTATASANIISVVGTSKEAELNFGKFSSNKQPGEITVTPFNQIIVHGGVTTGKDVRAVEAASFRVYGSTNDHVISLPQECMIVREDGQEAMLICSFNIHSAADPATPYDTQKVSIGATLKVNPNQVPGVYIPSQPFEVMINYN
ncbi:DUF4402 domain-containing protein [Aridibaculum aurantiacum]|uniref:DUF4402 domain-containing protein n=1 Tax=Aridibaculum aurantiacum TaxID=2810307 RepID=UPI001A960550|nr:DUF4402 domain-containing protein [Aridibaculum aurantiacum]